MKRFFGCIAVASAFTLVLCVHAFAAGGKIGYLDVTGAAAQSSWGKKISDDLKKEQERLAGTVEQKNAAFVTARDDYLKKKDVMDAKAKDKKEQELRGMAEDLQKLANESQTKWTEQKNAAMTPLFQKIKDIADKIAKEEKYDFILEKNALVVNNGKDDITAQVVTELNKTGSPK
ncbi:putative Outer membrane chaperone Skp (OmpH) [Syntrophobacter sp. SbD1]|nr:putative Outer membrane chaperone Skp (OmpH) [Syntrophobacter sp. SbD1]